ncbi:hypothetical protein ACIQW5_25930 [Methylorubrum thiocyanatum]|uniref:hypothetical protein n=1 Tax=Methylorubrum TaxID=2282523 RepID=UPI000DB3F88C|nr:hypothetical protein [Methylorubrum populi]PZP68390.1 MAG: hypothetical protein DI590_16715 [Methylorubrum populi]
MLNGRLIPWHQYVEKRPAMQGCPSHGVLALRVEWDGSGEVVRISGLCTQPAREVVFVDRLADPAILTSAEMDAQVRAGVLALGAEASP